MALSMNVIQCVLIVVFHWGNIPGVTSTQMMNIPNIALNKPTQQSSTRGYRFLSKNAVDGNFNRFVISDSCTHTANLEGWKWWMVDLEDMYTIRSIRITNRGHESDRLRDFAVEVSVEEPRGLQGFPGRTEAPVCFTRAAPVPPENAYFECNEAVTGRYIRVVTENILTLCEFEVFTQHAPFLSNDVAFGMPTNQSSTYRNHNSSRAVDGNTNVSLSNESCTHTDDKFKWHWWMVDLQIVYTITHIRITTRADHENDKLLDFTVEASVEDPSGMEGFPGRTGAPVCFSRLYSVPSGMQVFACDQPVEGRYVRIADNSKMDDGLSLCEVEIFGTSLEPSTMSTRATVNTTLAIRGATVTRGNEEAETHSPTPEVDEAEDRVSDGRQPLPTQEGKNVLWMERWVKWKEWMVEGRIGHTKLPWKKTCLICC